MPPADPELPASNEAEDDDLGVLCPNCAFSNAPDVDFCARCRAPLSMLATIDPLKQTFSEGFAYRKAVDGTSQPIVLVGIWLIFFPAMALSVFKAVGDGSHTAVELSWTGLSAALSSIILYRTTAGFLRKRREIRETVRED